MLEFFRYRTLKHLCKNTYRVVPRLLWVSLWSSKEMIKFCPQQRGNVFRKGTITVLTVRGNPAIELGVQEEEEMLEMTEEAAVKHVIIWIRGKGYSGEIQVMGVEPRDGGYIDVALLR